MRTIIRARRIASLVILLSVSSATNAAPVNFVSHMITMSNGNSFVVSIGGGPPFSPRPQNLPAFDWDGTTLTATGTYIASLNIAASPFTPSLWQDGIVNLVIDTGTISATAASYQCNNQGLFPFANACGAYGYGANFIDESTTTYSGTTVTQVIGGDDVSNGTPRDISRYDLSLKSDDGITLVLWNSIDFGDPGSIEMTFSVIPVPAALWLFGSAIGLLCWLRRKTA